MGDLSCDVSESGNCVVLVHDGENVEAILKVLSQGVAFLMVPNN
jgi:hypothetical protein